MSVWLRRVFLACTCASVLVACGGEPEAVPPSPTSTVTASTTAPSDAGGEGTRDSEAASEPAIAAPSITPSTLDFSQLSSACTSEGKYRAPLGGVMDPAPDGAAALIVYEGLDGGGDVEDVRARLSVDHGDGPQQLEPAQLGSTFTLDGERFAITSICEDAVEFDRVN